MKNKITKSSGHSFPAKQNKETAFPYGSASVLYLID